MDPLDEIKSKIDIVSFISEYVPLRRAGRNFKALCPFHKERTPSFIVSPELGIWRCFGACGEGGDVFKFLMKIDRMDFPEAVRTLAQRTGVNLPQRLSLRTNDKEKLYKINEQASRFYHYLLTRHSIGGTALSFVKRERDLTQETVERFELGFAPRQDVIVRFLVEKRGFAQEDLVQAGLVIKSAEKLIDRFRSRIIFPLRDERGNTVGFSGRLLPKDESTSLSKYINSPETLVYQKRRHLFGIDVTREDIRKEGSAVVVEGEFDLLSSWQGGIKNIVAIKGTAFTEEQTKLLLRFTPEAVLALDSDRAGEQATKQGILLAQEAGLNIRVTALGTFKDPDEAIRRDKEGFIKKLKNATPSYDFFIERAFSHFDPRKASGVASISRELVPIILGIGDKILQAHYIKVLADRLRIPEEAVAGELEKSAAQARTRRPPLSQIIEEKKTRREIIEEHLMSLALQVSPQFLISQEAEGLIKTPALTRIREELKSFLSQSVKFSQALFVRKLPKELVDIVTYLLLAEITTNEIQAQRELEHLTRELRTLELGEKIDSLIEKIKMQEKKRGATRREQEELSRLVSELAQIKS